MSRSRAAVLIGLAACAAGCIGYLAGSGLSDGGATVTERRQEGEQRSASAPGQSEQEQLPHALDLAGVSGQERALLETVNTRLSEDGLADDWLVPLARHLGQADPDLAADIAAGFRGTRQALFLLHVAENLPGDSAAMSAWLDGRAGHPSHDELVEAAVNNLARQNVDAAAALVESLPDTDDDAAFDFARALATNNPEKAIALFADDTWDKGDIAAGWAEINPDEAIAWFAANGMYDHGNMLFDDLLEVLARTAPTRAVKILADYPASESDKSYPAAVLAGYLDEDEDALQLVADYGLDETFTMRRRAEMWERIDACPPI